MVAANSASVSAAENPTAHNSGTYSDFDDTVSVSGTGVTDNHNGTWSWTGTGEENTPQCHGDGHQWRRQQQHHRLQVTFTDVAPVVTQASASVSAAENQAAHNSGTYSDYDDTVSVSGPGVTDNHNGTWSWTGTGDENTPYSVTVTATNGDGSTSTTSFQVSFTDVRRWSPPASASVSAAENQAAHNSGTYSDYDDTVSVSGPGVTDNHNGTWSWTGTGDEDTPYSVTVTATNGDGSTSTTAFQVSFTDVAPVVTAGQRLGQCGGERGSPQQRHLQRLR